MGQKGTRDPSSCAMPSASAVLPVPGAPVISSARPANFFCLRGREGANKRAGQGIFRGGTLAAAAAVAGGDGGGGRT